jgi:hypothetical protein
MGGAEPLSDAAAVAVGRSASAPAACRQGLVGGAAARVRVPCACDASGGRDRQAETCRSRRPGVSSNVRFLMIRTGTYWRAVGPRWTSNQTSPYRTVRSRLALKNGRRGGVANTYSYSLRHAKTLA